MSEFPKMVSTLPVADIPMDGVLGKLLQGKDMQVVFFEIEPIGEIPPHTHGAQWGVVLEGQMELTIGGETRTYTKGDTYYIPAGVEHGATFKSHFKCIDLFADRDRYRTKD